MIKSILQKVGRFFATLGTMILVFIFNNKILSAAVALVVVIAVVLTCVLTPPKSKGDTANSSSTESVSSVPPSSSEAPISSEEVSSEEISSEMPSSKPVTTPPPSVQTTPMGGGWDIKYNSNLDIEDNVFMDSMVYTGYNLEKHRADGNMWKYILASRKRGMGYLSNISYGGGSTGYETTADGKPDLRAFERGGLVCASYATYVYFNYLPNVAGIDTSSLPRPVDSTWAEDWYQAAMKWVDLGYSKTIPFTATKDASKYIVFKPSESVPIGSIVIFATVRKDGSVHWDRRSHVAIYGGYKNGYNWIYHVGNENGPEMCAIERVLYGPDPQWPYAVITPPAHIRMAAQLSVSVKDDTGAPVAGVPVTAKNSVSGATIDLGTTDANGVASKEGLKYGAYTVSYTLSEGYTATSTMASVDLTTKNNSQNTLDIKVQKLKPVSSAQQKSEETTEK